MREIKFRVWSKDNQKMYYLDDENYCLQTGGQHWGLFPYENPTFAICNNNFGDELMQYTGLKDKNGVEIYEGDILEEGEEYYFEVVWDKEWAKFNLKWINKAFQYPQWNRGIKMQIVGNRFENPELLEG